ncbi:hypothetical protein [Candidatus Electronema sp. PJ]|uniref:hypothetical protein n=1 Tax=Candidatus Electronema sp. PJ TaxID=3401572 RepID=UPI003AA7E771
MSLLAEYHLYIMIAALVGLVFFIPSEYRKKKSIITMIVVLAFSSGYELVMKEPVTRMPSRINRALNQDGADHDENTHYYQDPISRSKKTYNN